MSGEQDVMSNERGQQHVTYGERETEVPVATRSDPLWNAQAHRMALFVADLAWFEAERLPPDRRAWSIADQPCRSAGVISADITEGYSR